MSLRRRLIQAAGVLGALALLAVDGASAERDRKHDANCTWGASSVIATTVNGQLVETQPQTTGCVTP